MTTSEAPTALELAGVDELIQELKKRFDGIVMVYDRLGKLNKGDSHLGLDWQGISVAHCRGLLEYAVHRLTFDRLEHEKQE